MNVLSKNPSRKRDGQFIISIPFMWEEKPGKPKKDWKPSVDPKADDIAAPVKFIASIPFQWEEKPGTPLPCFSQSPVTPLIAPRYSEDEDSSMVDGVGCSGGNTESSNEVSESELDLDGSRNNSFSLAPSLMANGLISTWEISNAIPFEEIVQYNKQSGDELQCPLSPASQAESSSSGNSFLEWLFPLSIPPGHASFNGKVDMGEKIKTTDCPQKHMEELNHGTKETAIISRPSTLEELIVMSRRRTYQKKDHSMDLKKKEEFGCCMFGANNGIRLLHQKCKNQIQLKLL